MKFNRQAVALLLGAFILLGVASCKKSTDYTPVPYVCGCGSFNWQGSSFQLLNSSYILADSTELLSRKYYITADIQIEGENRTHSVNMTLEIPYIGDGTVFVDENIQGFTALIEEFNVNDPVQPLRQFVPLQGTVQINPALFGGTETVNFAMTLKELYEGAPVGFDVPFSGNFRVLIQL